MCLVKGIWGGRGVPASDVLPASPGEGTMVAFSSPEVTFTVKEGGGRGRRIQSCDVLWLSSFLLLHLYHWKVNVPPADTPEHSHPPGCAGTHRATTSHPGQAGTPPSQREIHTNSLIDTRGSHTLPHADLYLLGTLLALSLCTEHPPPLPQCSLYQRRKRLGDMACVMYEVKLKPHVKPICKN